MSDWLSWFGYPVEPVALDTAVTNETTGLSLHFVQRVNRVDLDLGAGRTGIGSQPF